MTNQTELELMKEVLSGENSNEYKSGLIKAKTNLLEIGAKYSLDKIIDERMANSSEHYTYIHDMDIPGIYVGKRTKKVTPKKDADIHTAKGQIAGFRINSVYNRYTNATQFYSASKESLDYSEKELNIITEVEQFLHFAITMGYATEEMINSMVQSNSGVENAYSLHGEYGTKLAQIKYSMNLHLAPARQYLNNKYKNIVIEDKTERWIYDKAKHNMSLEWNHKMANLFTTQEILTEQFSAKANNLVIGTSEMKYALTACAMYRKIYYRELEKERNFTATTETPTYRFEGIASVFSLFSIGTGDFLLRYRAMEQNIVTTKREPIKVNATVVVIPFRPDTNDREMFKSVYLTNDKMINKNVEFKTNEEGDITWLDRFVIQSATSHNSQLGSEGKQMLLAKDILAEGDSNDTEGLGISSELKMHLAKKYNNIKFSKHGVFTIAHESYSGEVLYVRIYKTMAKMFLVNVNAYNNLEKQAETATQALETYKNDAYSQNGLSSMPEGYEDVYAPYDAFAPQQSEDSYYDNLANMYQERFI